MPGCVLRISGPASSVSDAVRDAFVPFREARGSVLARERGESSLATYNYTVSEALGTEVRRQVQEAEVFVRTHLGALRELLGKPGVESGVLDFGCEIDPGSIGTGLRWPTSLLATCGQIGLDLEVSIYVVEVPEGSK